MEEKIKALKQEIEAIESSRFYLQMKDHWSNDDFHTNDVYCAKIRELKAELKALGYVDEEQGKEEHI